MNKHGFEVYYYDGSGMPPKGPLDFNEFMKILGESDGNHNLVAPVGADGPVADETQLSLFNREPTEPESSGAGEKTTSGA